MKEKIEEMHKNSNFPLYFSRNPCFKCSEGVVLFQNKKFFLRHIQKVTHYGKEQIKMENIYICVYTVLNIDTQMGFFALQYTHCLKENSLITFKKIDFAAEHNLVKISLQFSFILYNNSNFGI